MILLLIRVLLMNKYALKLMFYVVNSGLRCIFINL